MAEGAGVYTHAPVDDDADLDAPAAKSLSSALFGEESHLMGQHLLSVKNANR